MRHMGDVRHIPLRDVGLERCRIIEHIRHADDTRHVPLRDVGIK